MLVAREGKPGVDDDDLAGDLEHSHVLPDLAEAAERDHPQDGVAHAVTSKPSRARQSRTRSSSSSVGGTSGRR